MQLLVTVWAPLVRHNCFLYLVIFPFLGSCFTVLFWFVGRPGDAGAKKIKLKDRITPHVTNFFRLRLTIEKQEGKRKYKSDGAVMVGEFVYVCMFMYSE